MKKNCRELVRNLLERSDYELRSKKREQDFSRNRKMTFKNLMWFMLGGKGNTQSALDRYFAKTETTTHMTQQAFSLTRQKVRWEAFRELFQTSAIGSYNEDLEDWRGYLLMTVDGRQIALPPDPALREYYG